MNDYPLPQNTREVLTAAGVKPQNIGLFLDRFIDWDMRWGFDDKLKDGGKKGAFKDVIAVARSFAASHADLTDSLVNRQRATLDALRAKGLEVWSDTLETDWRLTAGLGTPGVLETGMTTHRVYGVPYIPGSALKGMTKVWARSEGGADKVALRAVFGSDDAHDAEAGSVVFFDALPAEPPTLKMDVMNPHYGDYYQKKVDDHGQPIPPAEWLTPVPVYFLTVEKTSFLFALAVRRHEANSVLDTARQWLLDALENMGAGGKTTAGYGYFSKSKPQIQPAASPTGPVATQTVTSVSPSQPPVSSGPPKGLTWKKGRISKDRKRVLPEGVTDPTQSHTFRQEHVLGPKGWTYGAKDTVEFALERMPEGKSRVWVKKLYYPVP